MQPENVERWPGKVDTLRLLRSMGAKVDWVIDVGVQTKTPELMQVFGDVPHLLCEPIKEYYDDIRKNYSSGGVKFELEESAICDFDGEVSLQLSSMSENTPITHAKIADEADSQATVRTVAAGKLDTVLERRAIDGQFLLKIDVDGAELDVLNGAPKTIAQSNVVIIEATRQTIFDRAEVLLNSDFELFDIVDICYYNKRLSQVDLVFVKKSVLKEIDEQDPVLNGSFDFSKWWPLKQDRYQRASATRHANSDVSKGKSNEELFQIIKNYRSLSLSTVRSLAEKEDLESLNWRKEAMSRPFEINRWQALKRRKQRGKNNGPN